MLLKISLFLSLFGVFGSILAQNDGSIVVNLPDLGSIRGRTVQTIGNRGREPKSFYNFRNIPFAQSVSGPHRFSVWIAALESFIFSSRSEIYKLLFFSKFTQFLTNFADKSLPKKHACSNSWLWDRNLRKLRQCMSRFSQ